MIANIPTILLLLCCLFAVGEEPERLSLDSKIKLVAVPSRPDIKAIPELLNQLGIPHAIIVYGERDGGILSNPKPWLSAYRRDNGTIRECLDDWCRINARFSWEESKDHKAIMIFPVTATVPAWKMWLQSVAPIPADHSTVDLDRAIDVDVLRGRVGDPVAIEIEGVYRMFRSTFAYATRGLMPEIARNPHALAGQTVADSLISDMQSTPNLHWQIWSEHRGTNNELTIFVISTATKPKRLEMTIQHVVANLDPTSHALDGYGHELIRIDDAILELYRRLAGDPNQCLAELDHQHFFARIFSLNADEAAKAACSLHELIGQLIRLSDPKLVNTIMATFNSLDVDARNAWVQAIPIPEGLSETVDATTRAIWKTLAEDKDPDIRSVAQLALSNGAKAK